MKRTKIMATLGPVSDSTELIEKMIEHGMNLVRLNFSHGSHDYHRSLIKKIRRIAKYKKSEITILGDLQGPKIRVGNLGEEGIEVFTGDKVAFISERLYKFKKKIQNYTLIPIQYKNLYRDVKKGVEILVEDGKYKFRVDKVEKEIIKCTGLNTCLIKSYKGINVPQVTISAEVITEKDKEDLRFAIRQGIDIISLSFVKESKDILKLKKIIKKHVKDKKYLPKMVAKIERREAINNFDDIIKYVDGVMIARGDLGVEVPEQDLPILQKDIIINCLQKGKFTIVATQMLGSMIINHRPTRAELTDVANAVIDHADIVMLSGETAIGKYPVECVNMMKKLVVRTEKSKYDDLDCGMIKAKSQKEKLIKGISQLAVLINAYLIITVNNQQDNIRFLARHRPEINILVLTESPKLAKQLNAYWGVIPFVVNKYSKVEKYLKRGLAIADKLNLLKKNEKIVFYFFNHPLTNGDDQNLIKIIKY